MSGPGRCSVGDLKGTLSPGEGAAGSTFSLVRAMQRHDVDKRGKPVRRRPVIVLDDVGIGIDNGRVLPGVRVGSTELGGLTRDQAAAVLATVPVSRRVIVLTVDDPAPTLAFMREWFGFGVADEVIASVGRRIRSRMRAGVPWCSSQRVNPCSSTVVANASPRRAPACCASARRRFAKLATRS